MEILTRFRVLCDMEQKFTFVEADLTTCLSELVKGIGWSLIA